MIMNIGMFRQLLANFCPMFHIPKFSDFRLQLKRIPSVFSDFRRTRLRLVKALGLYHVVTS